MLSKELYVHCQPAVCGARFDQHPLTKICLKLVIPRDMLALSISCCCVQAYHTLAKAGEPSLEPACA